MNRSRLLALSLAHGLVHGTMNIFPVVLEPVRRQFEWSVSEVAWVGTVGYVLFGLMALPAGWISDRVDRDRLVLFMLLGMAVSLLGLGLWTTPVGFLVCWGFVGFFAGFYHPLGLSSVVSAGAGETGRAMGWHGFGGNFGFALMPLLAGGLAGLWNWPSAFLFAGGSALLLSVVFLRVAKRSDTAPPTTVDSIDWSAHLIILLILYGSVGFIYRGMITFVPSSFFERWSHELSLGAVGGLTTLVYLLGGVGQLGGGWLEERFDSYRSFLFLVGGYTLLTVGLFWLDGILFLLVLMAWACLFFAGQPILNSVISRTGGQSTHGRLYGLAFAMNLGLGATGAGATGQAIDWGGFNYGYSLILLVSLTVLILTAIIITSEN